MNLGNQLPSLIFVLVPEEKLFARVAQFSYWPDAVPIIQPTVRALKETKNI